MLKLRKLDRLDEIARRIVSSVEDVHDVVERDRHDDVILIHEVENVSLPMRVVLESEYKSIKKENEEIEVRMSADPKMKERDMRLYNWNRDVLLRYEKQKEDPHPVLDTEIHIIRIGDVVICTNQFELFTDYGIVVQARSKAVQTFVVQLAGNGTYLPTEKAVKGGHYSAIAQSNLVGPEGGQILVDRTVELINEMFHEEK